jgi:integrase/recombinase XerD
MAKHNPANERIKREYVLFQRNACHKGEALLDAIVKAIARFEAFTRHRDFRRFHREQAIGFKEHLREMNSRVTGDRLSQATIVSTLRHLREFFGWLFLQPTYRSRLVLSDINYFNASGAELRRARGTIERPVPTLEQVMLVLGAMPADTAIDLRNRAVVALILLTGARDRAVASLKLKHVDTARGCIVQDAREVRTKNSKTITSFFFPVPDEARRMLVDWVQLLRRDLYWGDNDPLFPATEVMRSANQEFGPSGLKRAHWSNATPIRTIFKQAFARVGLPYFNPHSFRHMLAKHAGEICQTPEQYKAWSQNLGHEKPLTTFMSYGTIPIERQMQVLRTIGRKAEDASSRMIEAFQQFLAKHGDSHA